MIDDNEAIGTTIDVACEAKNMLDGFVRISEQTQNYIPGSTHLGIIEECEKDKNGKYTGKATVRFVTAPAIRTRCLLPVPSGQAYWFGGLPPAGTLCQITWLPLGVAIVTAVYPLNFRTLVDQKRFLDVIPGELLIQASSGVLKEGQTRAGRGLFDRHGRIEFETVGGTARIVLGDPGLENGLATLTSEDVDTGEKTILRIQAGNAVVNITDQENIVVRSGAGAKVIMKGNDITISCDALKTEVTNGKRLATEDFVLDVYNGHRHDAGAFSADGKPVVGTSGMPDSRATDNHMTDDVRVK